MRENKTRSMTDIQALRARVEELEADVERCHRLEDALGESESQWRAMSEATHDALIVINDQDEVLFWNRAAEKMFGYTTSEAVGRSMHELISLPEDRERALAGMPEFARTGLGKVVNNVREVTAVRKGGAAFPAEQSVASFRRGGRWYAVGTVRDITRRKEQEEQLRLLATTDDLTGLHNRRQFMKLAGVEFDRARRYGLLLSALMLDLDHFKRTNDTYGHEVGDAVLRALADNIRTVVRKVDLAGRLGGEEFAILLPETDLGRALVVAERLREAAARTSLSTSQGEVRFTISLGAAALSPAVEDLQGLLRASDQAMYRAKERGRNRVEKT